MAIERRCSPGLGGSVYCLVACEPEGRWFDSQSGPMPGLRARSPVGGLREATNRCVSCTSMFLSSLPLSLKIIKSLTKRVWVQIVFPEIPLWVFHCNRIQGSYPGQRQHETAGEQCEQVLSPEGVGDSIQHPVLPGRRMPPTSQELPEAAHSWKRRWSVLVYFSHLFL